MMTYLVLNILFMAILLLVYVLSPATIKWRPALAVLGILILTTALFDSLIVGLDIVEYYSEQILGVYVGRAPIEDFAYAITAALFVPYLWERLGRK